MMTEKQPLPWWIWGVVAITLPVLYALSIGPAVWMVQHGYLSFEFAIVAYWPLQIATKDTVFAQWILWYTGFWTTP